MKSLAKLYIATLIVAICTDTSSQTDTSTFQVIKWNKTYTINEIENGVALQYHDGDVIIGLMIPQHIRSLHRTCGDIESYGVQVMETVNMLIEKINANDSILPGVKLGTLALDTCAIDTHAVRMIARETFPYFWEVSESSSNNTMGDFKGLKPFAGFIGAASSDVTILSSKILQVFKIPQVSFFSTNPELSDKKIYPYVFRTVPSDAHQAEAMMKFIQIKGWNYISVVYLDSLYGSRAFSKIQEQAKILGICIAVGLPIADVSPPQVYDDAVNKLLEHPRARVVILFVIEREAEYIMKVAQNSSKAKERFIWIGSDAWTGLIPVRKGDTSYIAQLRRSIGFLPTPSDFSEFNEYFQKLRLKDRTGANSSLNPWFAPYLSKQLGCKLSGVVSGQRFCSPDDHLTASDYEKASVTHYMSDAVMVWAQALNELHKKVCRGQRGLCAELQHTIGTNKLATLVFPYLKSVSIPDHHHRGHFMFDEHQDGPKAYDLRMYVYFKEEGVYRWSTVGRFVNNTFEMSGSRLDEFVNISSVCADPCNIGEKRKVLDKICCWTCIPCSSDEIVTSNGTECINCSNTEEPNQFRNACMPLVLHNLQLGSPFTIVPILVSTLGILLTICIAAIYIKNRDTPIVKASSKELSSFVFVGSIICLLNGYVTIGGLNKVTCAVSRIILSIGPTFMYSGLLTKTVRIVIIFQSKNILKKHWKAYIRPMPQIITTLVLIIFQVFIVTTWFLISLNERTFVKMDKHLHYDCSAVEDAEILIALAFPFILIVVCTFLATINRNVPSGFNETRYVGLTMYTTCVIWLAFVPIVLLNVDKVPLKVMTTSICLSLSAITVMTFLFAPRCYDIILRPERNTPEAVMDKNGLRSKTFNIVSPGHASVSPREKILQSLSSEI